MTVTFLKGEQTTAIERPGSGLDDAIREVLVGPTALEARRGITTQILRGTALHHVSTAGGIATVDLGPAILEGATPRACRLASPSSS